MTDVELWPKLSLPRYTPAGSRRLSVFRAHDDASTDEDLPENDGCRRMSASSGRGGSGRVSASSDMRVPIDEDHEQPNPGKHLRRGILEERRIKQCIDTFSCTGLVQESRRSLHLRCDRQMERGSVSLEGARWEAGREPISRESGLLHFWNLCLSGQSS